MYNVSHLIFTDYVSIIEVAIHDAWMTYLKIPNLNMINWFHGNYKPQNKHQFSQIVLIKDVTTR